MGLARPVQKRVFPGAYAPTLGEVFERALEPHAFSVLDVENLRLHYAKTLEHWRQRFHDSSGQVASMFDDTFVRAWDLYLAGSQAAFSRVRCSCSRSCLREAPAMPCRGRASTAADAESR